MEIKMCEDTLLSSLVGQRARIVFVDGDPIDARIECDPYDNDTLLIFESDLGCRILGWSVPNGSYYSNLNIIEDDYCLAFRCTITVGDMLENSNNYWLDIVEFKLIV